MKSMVAILSLLLITSTGVANQTSSIYKMATSLEGDFRSLSSELKLEQTNQKLKPNLDSIISKNLKAQSLLSECRKVEVYFDESQLAKLRSLRAELIAVEEQMTVFSGHDQLRIEQAKLLSNIQNANYCQRLSSSVQQAALN